MSLRTYEHELKLETFNNVPCFSIINDHPLLQRVFGGRTKKGTNQIYYPAFYPYFRYVVNDFKVLKYNNFSHTILQHIRTENLKEQKILNLDTEGYEFFTKPLGDYQIEGFVWGINLLRLGLLFSTGLGKTKVALDIIRHLKIKSLVIVMAINLSSWRKNILTHAPDLSFVIIDAKTNKKKNDLLLQALEEQPDLVVMSYDMLKKYIPYIHIKKWKKKRADAFKRKVEKAKKNNEPPVMKSVKEKEEERAYEEKHWPLNIMKYNYQMMILDESQKLRQHDSQRTLNVLYADSKASRRIIMSGTHSLGDPRHVWAQHRFLAPFMTEKHWNFCQKFVDFSPWDQHVVIGFKNLDKLNKRLSTFAIIRNKDVLNLPPRTFHTIEITPTSEMKKNYNSIVDLELIILPDSSTYMIDQRVTQLVKLQQVTGGFIKENIDITLQCDTCKHKVECAQNSTIPTDKECHFRIPKHETFKIHRFKTNPKMDALFNKLDEILEEPDNKVLVWFKSTEEIKIACERMTETYGEDSFTQLHGEIKNALQERERFESDPKARVNFGQISMGVGINEFANANYVFYFSMSNDLEHYLQSRGRNYRIGTLRQVTMYFLQIKKSIDAGIVFSNKNKIDINNNFTKITHCIACQKFEECTKKGINPYDNQCVYSKKVTRSILKLQRI